MNIFEGLKELAFPYYPIFAFKGREIKDAIFESWGASTKPDSFLFPDRLTTIISIVKAKALRYRFENKEDNRLKFEDLIMELCPENRELAEETATLVNNAVCLEQSIQSMRSKYNFDGKVEISDDRLDEIVIGPIYHGASYDEFISSAINFQTESLKEIFLHEILIDFEASIYFGKGNETHEDVQGDSLNYLNKMRIYKCRTLDLLKTPDGGYFLCVDVNNRFKDGDYISSDSAWIFGQESNHLSIVIIK